MMLSISFLNAASDSSINYRCRERKDGPYAAEYFGESGNMEQEEQGLNYICSKICVADSR